MAVIRQDDAQKLLDQIELLRKLITGQGTNAHAVSTAIELSLLSIKQECGVDAQGKIQKPIWDAIAQDGREALYQRLFILVERLTRAVVPDPEGPLTDNSIMYYKHTPDWAIWFVMVGAILLTLGVLWEISARWEKATRREVIPNSELAKSEPISTPLKPQPSSSVEDPNQAIPARKQSGVASPASKSVTDSSVVGTPTKNEPTQSKPVAISPIRTGIGRAATHTSSGTVSIDISTTQCRKRIKSRTGYRNRCAHYGDAHGDTGRTSASDQFLRQICRKSAIVTELDDLLHSHASGKCCISAIGLLASAGRSIGTSTNERQLSGDESLWHLCYCRHDGTLL